MEDFITMDIKVSLDDQGKFQLPEEILSKLGITSATELSLHLSPTGIHLKKTLPSLTKVYIEPTTACNLNCSTCVRHSWNEPSGFLDMKIYKKMIDDLTGCNTLQQISFWGFGEPLLHPGIAEMVSLAKELGVRTQIITNALLLTREMAEALVSAGLDSIVISVDGASTESNDKIRSGASLNIIKEHIKQLRNVRRRAPFHNPEIGIEFVLMRRNMEELQGLRRLAFTLGASFIILTNLLPYTEELKDDILYKNSIHDAYSTGRSKWFPEIKLPSSFDLGQNLVPHMAKFLNLSGPSTIPVLKPVTGDDCCRFIAEGTAVVGWDGAVSPCPPLTHSYTCYVMGREKHIKRYTIGNISSDNIRDIMQDTDFTDFRGRILHSEFSPCLQCGGCELSESNEEDCYGNTFPVCGDCLWGKGVIQCP